MYIYMYIYMYVRLTCTSRYARSNVYGLHENILKEEKTHAHIQHTHTYSYHIYATARVK